MRQILFLSIICIFLSSGCASSQNQSEIPIHRSSEIIAEIISKLQTGMSEDEVATLLEGYGIKISIVKDDFTGKDEKGFTIASSKYTSYIFILRINDEKLNDFRVIAHSIATIEIPSNLKDKIISKP